MDALSEQLSRFMTSLLVEVSEVVATYLLPGLFVLMALILTLFVSTALCEAVEARRARRILQGQEDADNRELDHLAHDLHDSGNARYRALGDQLEHFKHSHMAH